MKKFYNPTDTSGGARCWWFQQIEGAIEINTPEKHYTLHTLCTYALLYDYVHTYIRKVHPLT